VLREKVTIISLLLLSTGLLRSTTTNHHAGKTTPNIYEYDIEYRGYKDCNQSQLGKPEGLLYLPDLVRILLLCSIFLKQTPRA